MQGRLQQPLGDLQRSPTTTTSPTQTPHLRRVCQHHVRRCVGCSAIQHDIRVGEEHPDLRQQFHALRKQMHALQKESAGLGPALHRRRLNKEDYDVLPNRIILLRHAESQGNVERATYCTMPDHTVPLTAKGKQHAQVMGCQLHDMLTAFSGGSDFKVFFMTSPYCRTLQTTDLLLEAFTDEQVVGVRSAVQLREQDFGNFQDMERISQDMIERQRFGRFYYRFPNGESGADVYDRLTIFEDHLTRDMLMGRFEGTSLALVTHGLTLRIFLMRWFHWAVDEFLEVFNPDNCQPIVVEKLSWEEVQQLQVRRYANSKHCYRITPESLIHLKGCSTEMSSYFSRSCNALPSRLKWMATRARMAERGVYTEPMRGVNEASFSFEEAVSFEDEGDEPDALGTAQQERIITPWGRQAADSPPQQDGKQP